MQITQDQNIVFCTNNPFTKKKEKKLKTNQTTAINIKAHPLPPHKQSPPSPSPQDTHTSSSHTTPP